MALPAELATAPVLRVVGLTVLSALVAMTIAAVYRWYFRSRIPTGVALLAGVSAVAVYLNTQGALGTVVEGQAAYLEFEAVVFNTTAFLTAGLITPAALRVGDRIATSTVAVSGAADVDGEVSKLVTTVGRRTAVTLPERIGDIEGYDPVPDQVKEVLAGRTLLFPRGITVDALRDRLVTRLKADYEAGYVDVDLATDGTAEYLALGQRVAGIGPTIGPGTGVVAVDADPPNSATAGDLVQVWRVEDQRPVRVATAEIRGVSGDVVTLALDAREAREIAGGSYRLLTLPVQPRFDREFAGLLRAADETMASLEIEPDSSLVDVPIRELGATVVAIKPRDAAVEPIPQRDRTLASGDLVYLVARPDVIRQLGATGPGT